VNPEIIAARRSRLREKHLAAPLTALLDAIAAGEDVTMAAEWLAEEMSAYEINMNRLNYRGHKNIGQPAKALRVGTGI